MNIISIHAVDTDKLSGVVAQMRELGGPTIRAVEYLGQLVAVEGVHRLAAAAQLGLPVQVEALECADMIDLSTLDDGVVDMCYAEGIADDGMVSAEALAAAICNDWQGDSYGIDAAGYLNA